DTPLRASGLDAKAAAPDEAKRKAMSPAKCAHLIITAAKNMQREVYIPRFYQWAVVLATLFPDVISFFAAKKYKF
ncbi:hypothetical protein HDU91_002205, partial [Kappamyces sp. JEL0680]